MLGERPAGDLDERLRNRLGERPQPRRQAAGEDGDRQAHANSTFVPSKSNRNRTSSRPAAVMAVAQPPMILGVEHQEAAAAGADQLAADRAVLAARARTTRRSAGCSCRPSAASCAPSARASARRRPRVSPFSSAVAAAEAELLHVVQVVAASRRRAARVRVFWSAEDAAGAAREAGEEQQQVVLEVEQRVHRQLQRLGVDAVVRVEREAGHAAVRGDVLVLLADRLAQPFDLDLARQLRQLVRMQQPPPVRVERLQQRGREAARRSEAGAGRDVGQRGDLDLRRPEVRAA